MAEPTLESIVQRVEELERRFDAKFGSTIPSRHDWRQVVGISERTDFSEKLIAEMNAIRNADREDENRE